MPDFESGLSLANVLPFLEEKLSVGLWRSDGNGQMQWSRGLYELFGLDPRRTTPAYAEIEKRIHPDDRSSMRCFGARELNRSLLEGEFRVIRPNGTLRWIHGRAEPLLDEAGKPECILGLARDITEQRNLLDALKVEAERYRALAEICRGFPWTSSSDGRLTAVSNALETAEDHGSRFKDWIGLIHEDDREAALREWAVSVETAQPYNVECRLRRPDGIYRWHQGAAVPLKNSEGGVREWLGTWSDAHHDILARERRGASKVTGRQLRAARGMLNWSVKELAERAGVSSAVIRRLEEYNDTPQMSDELMETLRKTFSEAGIEFTFPVVGKPGVRPR
ncbi:MULTISPECIES: PAS domain-containing protein [Bradyrhizobium]|uniref:histidine kinase n=3 Tax=Bradyrhizobium TaxID=374 RepID=A0AAE5X8G6_9BRAD|nr:MULTISPECIES: PAS domain-containing protein [Bradyrhizobium]MCG2633159.1 PAS domain-containing protein [Bradyrhizobium zhengyangense]MCG2645755.1 PAS domain-containing protein [Bradyrhizobium zhengyangense]MCG2673387.1 PAS domain-containing protein [Bradyrhizobium zhengyangense]MDN4985362.1 PAS domain-containing protein [Bradyrhizobium sp. WYCCWR 13022]MDN5006321.1 PAS domain-containing protein [Bradyrhizobium sp. WYCCWR 12677]